MQMNQAAAEEDTVASRIRERMGDCSPAERKVARTLLAAYPVAGFETVAGLADLAEVSGATVVRFTARLGYSGFPDFQRALRDELEQRSASPSSLFARIEADRPSRAGDLASLADASVQDLRATFAGLSEHDLETALAAIAHPKRRIWAVGGRYSGFLAEYLAASLQQLRPAVRMVPEMASLRAATLAEFDAKDVLIAFDFRRYESETNRLVRFAKARKSTVIVITDKWASPCSSDADSVLTSVTTERSPFDSAVPVLAIIEVLFESLVARIGTPARERMEQVESTAQRLELI